MATLSYTDIQPGVFFRMDGVVYETVDASFSKKSRQKGANQVRIRNIANSSVIAKTLHASDTPEAVDIEKKPFVFIYVRGDDLVLHPEGKPSERITVPFGRLTGTDLIPTNTAVAAFVEDDTILTVRFPIKTELRVKEAPPTVRGNTAQGGTKKVTLETGAVLDTPLFIETGDVVRVNTETGEYVERVSKA